MAKIQYWLKITFIFILILFIDSVNRVYRVQLELSQAEHSKNSSVPPRSLDHPTTRPPEHPTDT